MSKSKNKRSTYRNNSVQQVGENAKAVENQVQPEQAKANEAEVQKPDEDMVIQFGAHEVSTAEISEKVKKDYLAAGGDAEIKGLKIYVKPEDNKAYYVVNGETEGNVELISD